MCSNSRGFGFPSAGGLHGDALQFADAKDLDMRERLFRRSGLTLLMVCCLTAPILAEESPTARLARDLKPFLSLMAGDRASFALSASAKFPLDGKIHSLEMDLTRFDEESFELRLVHSEYALHLVRNREATAFSLPKHQIVYLGMGDVDSRDHLRPHGIVSRLASSGTALSAYLPLFTQADPVILARLLNTVLPIQYNGDAGHWNLGRDLQLVFGTASPSLDLTAHDIQLRMRIHPLAVQSTFPESLALPDLRANDQEEQTLTSGPWSGYRVVLLERQEVERQLARGVRRALEILQPSPELTAPREDVRRVEHGELQWIDGHRVVRLQGTPEQIGRAHGQLLPKESQRCIDSVLYTFGTAQTIVTGRWFRHDLEDAYARLAPYIPADHRQECRALAEGLGMEPELAEVLNVFPELFHCSGFAVMGKATKDGKLYHGRVLDYMTTIGLQDAATTFIVAVDGKIPFANIGYAGFIGSVSGMNSAAISLGEMGGRGEGRWDGVPMATLMRLALETCSTLDEVTTLWKTSPRTCEYYYVFADGKTSQSVGVAADPDTIQFIQPGEGHPLLGEGIEDAVILSSGSRLEKLRERVLERYGEIDEHVAQWLMSRPVAMNSNLHNVLFVPADRVFYVANATHRQPAAERPYVRLDLLELLGAHPPSVQAGDVGSIQLTPTE
jgi:hypothetical protein